MEGAHFLLAAIQIIYGPHPILENIFLCLWSVSLGPLGQLSSNPEFVPYAWLCISSLDLSILLWISLIAFTRSSQPRNQVIKIYSYCRNMNMISSTPIYGTYACEILCAVLPSKYTTNHTAVSVNNMVKHHEYYDNSTIVLVTAITMVRTVGKLS